MWPEDDEKFCAKQWMQRDQCPLQDAALPPQILLKYYYLLGEKACLKSMINPLLS